MASADQSANGSAATGLAAGRAEEVADRASGQDGQVTVIVQLEEPKAVSGMTMQSEAAQTTRHQIMQRRIRALAGAAAEADEADSRQGGHSMALQSSDDASACFGVEYDYYHAIDGFAVTVPLQALEDIRALDGVKSATVAREFEVPKDVSDGEASAALGNQSWLDMTGADAVEETGSGQVIAIIDSGLDVTHEAFAGALDPDALAWDEATARDKRARLSQGGKDGVYVSEKIPFAYDYGNNDSDVVPYNAGLSHGTHVAGIAAANAGDVRGVAPNAQIAAMKVANDASGGIPEAALIAAIDDAVVLAPDVLNMSLGSGAGYADEGSSPTEVALDTLRAQGCTVCASAGNSATSNYRGEALDGRPDAAHPDYGIVSSPSTYAAPISVASADNSEPTPCFMLADGAKVGYAEAYCTMTYTAAAFDTVADGTYAYVDAGDGSDSAIDALLKDHPDGVSDKIVLVEDGSVDSSGTIFMTGARVRNVAERLSPTAIVVYADGDGELASVNAGATTNPAVISVTRADGLAMLSAVEKEMTVAHGSFIPASRNYSMSYFTSWGPTPDLALKPEVTAPGGDIYSTVLEGKYDYKSGTSMAAPHIAGISAQVHQRLASDAAFASLGDEERANAVTQLIMSTACPVRDASAENAWYSPRRQGAGLANVPAAMKNDVLVSVEGADPSRPKAELGSDASGSWAFTVLLRNMGETAQVFKPTTVALCEDIADGKFQFTSRNYAGRGVEVSYGGDYDGQSGTIAVPAGGTASYTVSLACAPELDALVAQAPNGCYIDGFTMLEAQADGGVDLSVPFLGFYGDWDAAPVFDAKADSGEAAHAFASRLTDAATGAATGVNPLDREAAEAVAGGDFSLLDQGRTVVSNSLVDGAVNEVVPKTGLLRNAKTLSYEYLNAEDAVVASYEYSYVAKSSFDSREWSTAETNQSVAPSFNGIGSDGKQLPDGEYTLRLTATTARAGALEQSQEYSFRYDTTAPTIESYVPVQSGADQGATVAVSDETSIAGIGFFDPASGTVFHEVIADDESATVQSEGKVSMSIEIDKDDLEAAWSDAGLEGDVTSAQVYAWDYGMNQASSADAAADEFVVRDGVLVSYGGDSSMVTIPADVTSIGANAFEGTSVKAVVISANVQSIDARAFYGVESLKSVTFEDAAGNPSKLVSIGDEAFAKTSVESVVLPRSLDTLGSGAFAESKVARAFVPGGLESLSERAFAQTPIELVVFGEGVKAIGASAFEACESLAKVQAGASLDDAHEGMPDSLASIASCAFKGDLALENLTLGANVASIGSDAFAQAGIRSLVLPDALVQLDGAALSSLPNLEQVTVGAGLPAEALEGAFVGCRNLRSIDANPGSPSCCAIDGVLFNKDASTLICYPLGRAGSYEIPASVTRLAAHAFEGAAATEVVCSESLVSIGDSCFKDSFLAGSFVLPEACETIGAHALEGTLIDSLDIGGVKSIGADACANCASLSSVDLRCDRNRLVEIGERAFSPGTPLASIELPDSLARIEAGAFANNPSLMSLHIGAGVTTDYSALCAGCENIESLSVSAASATYYADNNVLYSKGADGMTLVLSLPSNAFESYDVAAGTVKVGKSAFKGNACLKRISFPEGLVSVEAGAFNGCSSLVEVEFPDSLQTVNGFYNTAIGIADFGTKIASIGKNAFSGHNPTHLVVRGGRDGIYESSSERGDDKRPIKTAYFGEGMVKANFAANRIMPPSLVVVGSTMRDIAFAPSSAKMAYDPSTVHVYAPYPSKGWDAAKTALEAIGADAKSQLHAYEPLSMSVISHDEGSGVVSLSVQAAGGIAGTSGYEYRFVEVSADGAEAVLSDWGEASSIEWIQHAGSKVRCEARDETLLSVQASYPNDGSSNDVVPDADGASKMVDAPAKKVVSITVNTKKVTAKTIGSAIARAGGNPADVACITLGKKVKKIAKRAFAGTGATKLVVKTKKLAKKSVKGCLKGSKVKVVQVKAGGKKVSKKLAKKYGKVFVKKVVGKKVKVKA